MKRAECQGVMKPCIRIGIVPFNFPAPSLTGEGAGGEAVRKIAEASALEISAIISIPSPREGERGKSFLLLVQIQVSLYSASYSTTYHGVVTNTQEAHHLYVSGN